MKQVYIKDDRKLWMLAEDNKVCSKDDTKIWMLAEDNKMCSMSDKDELRLKRSDVTW